MGRNTIILLFITICLFNCNSTKKEQTSEGDYSDVNIVGAMKHVMWKGELGSSIQLDTLSNKNGLYGLGPESFLKGELLINDGKSYVSKVTSDSTMHVEQTFHASAPFFVYANVYEWEHLKLNPDIKSIKDLESYIDEKTKQYKRPFAFKLTGTVSKANIHIQNLPEGTQVSSPDEAHQGQVNYNLKNEVVNIIGFFSTEHKGVFTHHDSFLHMHLITKNADKMGHLDDMIIEDMNLYLPIK
ncbi:acetolactate decarboxylase [Psychroserpens mesophilus]|uniref:acetolactate decarboxylase n=1 Tax=Psychroserpens mesophilus TaxID=325473 RepID=UPI003F49081C